MVFEAKASPLWKSFKQQKISQKIASEGQLMWISYLNAFLERGQRQLHDRSPKWPKLIGCCHMQKQGQITFKGRFWLVRMTLRMPRSYDTQLADFGKLKKKKKIGLLYLKAPLFVEMSWGALWTQKAIRTFLGGDTSFSHGYQLFAAGLAPHTHKQ